MRRPTDGEKCGNAWCGHPFAQHYTTYDGNKHGCSHYDDNQFDGGPCFCKGFAIVQAWTPSAPESSRPAAGPYWDKR